MVGRYEVVTRPVCRSLMPFVYSPSPFIHSPSPFALHAALIRIPLNSLHVSLFPFAVTAPFQYAFLKSALKRRNNIPFPSAPMYKPIQP